MKMYGASVNYYAEDPWLHTASAIVAGKHMGFRLNEGAFAEACAGPLAMRQPFSPKVFSLQMAIQGLRR